METKGATSAEAPKNPIINLIDCGITDIRLLVKQITINTNVHTCDKFYCTGSALGIINKTINMTVAAQKLISTCVTCLVKGINLLPPGG